MKSLLPLIEAIGHDRQELEIGNIDDQLVQYIINSGLASYLNYSIQNTKTININYDTLVAAELTAKIITNTQIQAIKEITNAAKHDVTEITLLKGISLCQNYYPFPHFRIMSDIDILILEKDICSLDKVLNSLGYKQSSDNPDEYYDTHHHCKPYYNEKNNVWVEAHTHLFSNMTPVLNDTLFKPENIRENRLNMNNQVFGGNVKYLCPELQLIYTCTHWAEDFNPHKTSIQFIDIILLIKNNGNGLDWIKTTNWLNNTASASYAYLILSFLHKHNIVKIPDIYFKSINLKYSNMGFINRYILYKLILNYMLGKRTYNSVFNENNVRIIWKTLLKPASSFSNLIQTPWNIIFPPEKENRYKTSYIISRIRNLINNS